MLKYSSHYLASIIKGSQKRFDNIMSSFKYLEDRCSWLAPYFIKMLGKQVQMDCLTKRVRYYASDEIMADTIPINSLEYLLFSENAHLNKKGENIRAFKKRVDEHVELSLTTDIVIPLPWNSYSIHGMLAKCKYMTELGDPWIQDANHVVEYWKPLDIAFVKQGNHSIAAGILASKGKIAAAVVYDISGLYDVIKCDGTHYTRVDTGGVIGPVRSIEFAAIFEIGRMLVKE